jgi:hypothetical protein
LHIDTLVLSGRKRGADVHKNCDIVLQDDDIFPDNSDINYALDDKGEDTEHPDLVQTVYYPPGTYFQPPESKGTHFTYTNQTKGYVQLLQFLDKLNAPKYAFDELLEILHLMSIQNFDFQTVHPRRKTVMGHIRQQFIPPECERIPVQMECDEGDPEDSP